MELAHVDRTAEPFIGRWNRLVSTTNWEKGRIICEWRAAAASAGDTGASDEAWSQLAGGVTPQHVGRLRRAYERFGGVYEQYGGLYWSHFQAALDWDDAEMWLEGAVQNGWSVAAMRDERASILGTLAQDIAGEAPCDEVEIQDEDLGEPLAGGAAAASGTPAQAAPDRRSAQAESRPPAQADEEEELDGSDPLVCVESDVRTLRPFAALPSLPADVADAFESFKLAILRHKHALWSEVSQEDLVATLEALKEFALAPAV